jgi:cell division protease FtsH
MTENNKDTSKKSKLNKKPQKKDWRNSVWYFLTAIMLVFATTSFFNGAPQSSHISFSSFLSHLESGQLQEITIKPKERLIEGKDSKGTSFRTSFIDYPEFISELRSHNVQMKIDQSDSNWFVGLFLQAFLPFILIGLLWFFIFRQAKGMGNQAMSFGKNKAKLWKKEDGEKVITFKDVAGIDEAVEELGEIVDFLKNPSRYKKIGADIPKGVLLMGSPGTGKTLLAKAIAGEANVPFFSLSGSDFVEMFVGVGASRVRDLFAQARKEEPCIIFLDEIDAVGRHRGAGVGGGHDEREQTLNQLLVEMDGFDSKQTVIVIAATNRPDILDPALQRPGRFDRQIVVDKPDIKGRFQILTIHAKKRKVNPKADLEIIAKRTPGFTGADLANLINEAALLAARNKKKIVEMEDLESATDRVIAGPERKSRIIKSKEKEIIAYHEMGHAIVAAECKTSDPVHKVSILPRGMALGYTLQLPLEDKHLISRSEIEDNIRVLMGGRVAEEIIFNEITSGASNDIEKATELARNYVCSYGMSKALKTRKYGQAESNVFLGKSYSNHSKDFSEETAREIDTEIRDIIDRCYKDATKILKDKKEKLIELSTHILTKEVIDGPEFKELYGNV